MNIQLSRLLAAELTIIATGVIFYFAGHLVARFAELSLMVAFAVLLTYALLPLVNFLNRFMPRALSALLVYVALFALLAGVALLSSLPLAKQAEQLARDYPQYSDEVKEKVPVLERRLENRGIKVDLEASTTELLSGIEQRSGEIVSKSGQIVAAVFGTLTKVFLVVVMSIYFILSGRHFIDLLVNIVPRRRQRLVKKVLKDFDHIMTKFVRGQLLISLFIGTMIGTFSALIGLPYPLLIGIVVGITSLIPLFGAIIGAALPITIAAFVNPILILPVIVFFVLINEFTDKVLYPRIVGRAVSLHPLVVFFGVLLGLQMAGVAGALLAAPILAMVKTTLLALGNSSGYLRS